MDDTLNVIDMNNDQQLFTQKFNETVSIVKYSYDGSFLVSACLDNKLTIFDNTFNKKMEFQDFEDEIMYIDTH